MSRGIECAAWGVVGRDAELKTSKSGTPYCSVSVGVTIGQDDAGKDIMQWVRVTVFKENAERAARTLTKGSRCYFEGNLTLNRWRTADGQERTDINVTGWKLDKLGAIGRDRPRAERAETSPRARRSDPQAPLHMAEPGPAGRFDPDLGDAVDNL